MADIERKSHITRIYKDNDSTSDSWIDVERLDELSFRQGRAEQYRLKRWKFNWDDFNPEGENVTKKKITNPKDESEFIEVPVRDNVLVQEGRAEQYQGNEYKFVNTEANKTRETLSRRVYHHPIKKSYLVDGKPPSDPTQYLDALLDQVKEQYVEVELLDRYWTKEKESKTPQGQIKPSQWQQKKWRLSEADPLLQEPMVETDETDPEFVPVRNPEAGTVDPPWRIDPLQNIVNVSWGGRLVFIAGDADGNVYYLKPKAEDPAWQSLGRLDFHKEEDGFFTGRVAGSAYAMIADAPVFVLVGGFGFADEIGIIMASSDGLNWSRVFTFKGNLNPEEYHAAGIFGVVWNETEQAFYAGGHQSDNFASAGVMQWTAEVDILFKSADGYSWTEVNRHESRIDADAVSGVFPPYPPYTTGLLANVCSTLVKDKNNNNVPGGNYGYDKKTSDLLIEPTNKIAIDYLFGNYHNDIPSGSSSVTLTIVGEGDPPSYPSDTNISLTCTATAGGKWAAGGGALGALDEGSGSSQAAILVPFEDGYIWQRLDPPGTNVIVTMTGGKTGKDVG